MISATSLVLLRRQCARPTHSFRFRGAYRHNALQYWDPVSCSRVGPLSSFALLFSANRTVEAKTSQPRSTNPSRQEYAYGGRPDSGTRGADGLSERREPGFGVAPSAGDPVTVLITRTRGLARNGRRGTALGRFNREHQQVL